MCNSKKPYRVLHVIGGMDRGGAETMLMNIYRNIDRSIIQFDFLVYYDREGSYDKEIVSLGGKVIRIQAPKKTGPLQAISLIRNVIKSHGPYIAIHGHTLFNSGFAMIAAKKENISIRISHSHSTSDRSNTGLVGKIYYITMKNIIKVYSTRYIACGREAGLYLFGNKFIKEGVVLNNSIDTKKFIDLDKQKVLALKKELGISKNDKVIGSVARMDEWKNHKFIIEVIKELLFLNSNYKLILVGHGPLRDSLQQKVKEYEMNEKVLFLGVRDDIPELMSIFDILLMPSIYEGLPVVLIEAQAAGVNCLISDCITDEVDLNMNLIHKLPINKGEQVWVDYLRSCVFESVSPIERMAIMRDKGYEVSSLIDKVYNLYHL